MRALLALVLGLLGASSRGTPAAPWKRHAIDDTAKGADGIRFADVNGDGFPDAVTAWEEGGVVRAYLHPGRVNVRDRWPAVTVGRVASGEDAVFADLDADGASEVVSSCEGSTRAVYVHWAPRARTDFLNAAAWKTEPIPATRGKRWMFCLPLQVDGKFGLDLVLGSKDAGADIGWLEAPADPRDLSAWKWHAMYGAGWVMSLFAVDVDKDGDLDILASDRKGKKTGCLWLENPGPGDAQAGLWAEHRIGGRRETMFVMPFDLDGDGRLDVLAASPDGLFFIRCSSSAPLVWEEFPIDLPPDTGSGKAVAAGDLDLDGKPDLVFSCENASGKTGLGWLSVGRAFTDRAWNARELSVREGIKFDLVCLLDLDGDGDLDVATTEERAALGVVWYENPAR